MKNHPITLKLPPASTPTPITPLHICTGRGPEAGAAAARRRARRRREEDCNPGEGAEPAPRVGRAVAGAAARGEGCWFGLQAGLDVAGRVWCGVGCWFWLGRMERELLPVLLYRGVESDCCGGMLWTRPSPFAATGSALQIPHYSASPLLPTRIPTGGGGLRLWRARAAVAGGAGAARRQPAPVARLPAPPVGLRGGGWWGRLGRLQGCMGGWAHCGASPQRMHGTAATCPSPSRRRTQFTGFSATEVAATYDDAFAALHREHARRAREGGCSVLLGG